MFRRDSNFQKSFVNYFKRVSRFEHVASWQKNLCKMLGTVHFYSVEKLLWRPSNLILLLACPPAFLFAMAYLHKKRKTLLQCPLKLSLPHTHVYDTSLLSVNLYLYSVFILCLYEAHTNHSLSHTHTLSLLKTTFFYLCLCRI